MAEEDDRRPESSPFAGFTTQVYFQEGPEFVVPTSLIRKCPKLISDRTRWPPSAIRLDDVASNIAHVIFYYLLTGTYQCLRPKGSSQHERLGNELTTGVQTYNAARSYELPALQDLAKDEIQRIAQELPFPLVLNLLRNLHLDPSERETWIDDYVQSGLQNLFRTPTAFLDLTSLQVEQDVISLSNILLKSLAGLLANDVALARRDNVAIPAPSSEPAAIEEVPVVVEELAPEEGPLPVPIQEPIYAEELLLDPTEPVPYDQEREVYPVPSPEPELAQEPAHESTYNDVTKLPSEPEPEPAPEPEIAIPEAEPEPEPAPAPAPKADSPADYVFDPTTWGGYTNNSKKESLWPEDEIVESPPEVVPEPREASIEYTPSRIDSSNIQYLEPEPIPDIARVDSPPADDESTPLVPAAPVAPEKSKKTKKKKMSIFRTAEESSEPEVRSIIEEAVPAAKPVPEPELPKAVDDAVLSPASSSTPVKKKKKKKSIFWSESGAA
ncbi:hypothetical protein E0Z10_g10181 [Xylaria hypoxylon]|uniref:Uncharacterized protein n=1 Tax=Xylaria hypoxylon TaxID=37992 RepID=A0A4Z0YIK2_9PEZI|nr:hypothetical protein E0Z10_g10181 [Xylaria hypoxylon]